MLFDIDRRSFLAAGVAFGVGTLRCEPTAADPKSPATNERAAVTLGEVRRIWGDGLHNGFPGIARHGDYYYITFRRALQHQEQADSKIVVIRSRADDLKQWSQVAEFVRDHDSRDPLLVVVGDAVQLVWHSKNDWYSRSTDGVQWSEPRLLDVAFPQRPADAKQRFTSERRWLFRIRRGPDGAFYSLARCAILEKGSPGPFGLILYRSTDGIRYEAMHGFGEGPIAATTKINAPGWGHEADLAWRPDGSLVAAIRMREGLIAQAPSIDGEWSAYKTGVFNFGGPALHTMRSGAVLLAARSEAENRVGPVKQMVWTVGAKGLEHPLELPSGSDCAYSSFCDGPDGDTLLCYYSGHERIEKPGGSRRPAHIYLAFLRSTT